MSLRGLLALVVGLAVAVALLFALGRNRPAAPPAPAEAPLLGSFAEGSIREIAVACEGASFTLGRRTDGGWRLDAPVEEEADPRRVRELISALQDAKARKTIEADGSNPGAFGLDPATCRVRVQLEGDSGQRVLAVGRTSPVGTDRYALPDGGGVALTDGSLHTVLARHPESYLEKRLIPVEPEAVTRMVIDRPGERLVLARDPNGWRMESPVNDRAAEGTCLQLSRAVAGVELEAVSSTQRPLEARTDRRIALEVAAHGAARPLLGFVARAGMGGKRVAWREGGALVGLVDEAAARELERPADAFRDRRVLSFSSPDVRSIEVSRGDRVLRVERAGEGAAWTCREDAVAGPADADRVNALIERLRVLTSVGFAAGPPPTPPSGSLVIGGPSAALGRVTWGSWPPDLAGGAPTLWLTTPARPGVVFKALASDLGSIPEHASDLRDPASAGERSGP